MSSTQDALAVHIRWMIRRDMPEVLEIEQRSHRYPWLEHDVVEHLRQRHCIGMVAERDDRVIGWMIYELHQARIDLLKMAVHPDWRHQGVATAMIDKLTSKLSRGRRTKIIVDVSEYNLDGQLFLKAMGFVCFKITSEEYWNGEDGYWFSRGLV